LNRNHYKTGLYKLLLVWEIHTHLNCSVMEEPFPSFHIQYPTKKNCSFQKENSFSFQTYMHFQHFCVK